MIFSTIKITFLVFAAFAVGTQAQRGKHKCGSCVRECVNAHEEVIAKQLNFTLTCEDECVIECDTVDDCTNKCGEEVKCLRRCTRFATRCNTKKPRKEAVCKKRCVKRLMKADTEYQNLLEIAKDDCEASEQCKIDPVCNVSECSTVCACDEAEDKIACKKECMKCKGALMKVCYSTCVNDNEDEGGRCDCGCTTCDTTCACDKEDDEYDQCIKDCKTCVTTLMTCTKTCAMTAKECVTGCGCDYPFRKRKPKRKGSGKFL